MITNPIDWHNVIKVGEKQQILPFLYYNIKRLNLATLIPQDIFRIMANYYYSNLTKNTLLEMEIASLTAKAYRENITIIPFRGFSLMQDVYHNQGLRIMVDVDILIKENDFQKVKKILYQSGYTSSNMPQTSDIEEQNIYIFSKNISHNQYIVLEIHNAIAPLRPYKINLPQLWNRSIEHTLHNQKIHFLSPEDTFISLALHLRRHTRRLTLKFIVDIAELLNKYKGALDWKYIQEAGRKNHIIYTIYFALYIIKELLYPSLSIQILNKFSPNMVHRKLIRLTINKYNFLTLKKWQGVFLRILLFDRPIDIILYVWRVIFLRKLKK